MTTINLPTEWPAGWAVGVDEENDVVAQSTDLGVGIHYWIDEDGVEHRNRADESPESVRTTARALHRSLGRPCPWDDETAPLDPPLNQPSSVNLDDPGCTCGGNGLCEHCRARAVPERKAFSTGYRCGLADAEAELDPQPVTVITEDGLAHFDIGPNRISFAIDSRSGAHAWFVNDERMVPARAPDQDQTAESDPDPTPATDEKREDVPERGQDRDCRECAHHYGGSCNVYTSAVYLSPKTIAAGPCSDFEPKPVSETSGNREPLDPDYVAIQRDEWTDLGRRVGVLERLFEGIATGAVNASQAMADAMHNSTRGLTDDQAKEAQETPPPQRDPGRDCETGSGTAADAGTRAEKETGSRTGCG